MTPRFTTNWFVQVVIDSLRDVWYLDGPYTRVEDVPLIGRFMTAQECFEKWNQTIGDVWSDDFLIFE